jgi:uncharacterized membrane protein (DUF485 family)
MEFWEFWAVIATVLPVLGLPLVLIARNLVGQMVEEAPRLGRFMALWFAITLLAIYVGEVVAISKLANAYVKATGDLSAQWVTFGVTGAAAALIMTPGLTLVFIATAGHDLRALSAAAFRFLTLLRKFTRLRNAYIKFRIRREVTKVVKMLDTTAATLNDLVVDVPEPAQLTPEELERATRCRAWLWKSYLQIEIVQTKLGYVDSLSSHSDASFRKKYLALQREIKDEANESLVKRYRDWAASQTGGWN